MKTISALDQGPYNPHIREAESGWRHPLTHGHSKPKHPKYMAEGLAPKGSDPKGKWDTWRKSQYSEKGVQEHSLC